MTASWTTDYESYALQLRTEIRDGETLLASLQHMKRRGEAGQGDVNEVRADLEYLRRELNALSITMTAKAYSVELPLVEEPEATRYARERLRNAARLAEQA